MKKIREFTVLFFFLAFIGLNAQSTFQITNQTGVNGVVSNNDIFYSSTTPYFVSENDFEVKNISTSNQTVTVRKSEILINTVSSTDYASAYFCTGTDCFGSEVNSAPMVLAPNETMMFKADLSEASVAGLSEIGYKFSASNESLNLTIKYTNTPTSIRSNSSVFSSVSGVYPNPSSSKSFINVTSTENINGAALSVRNSLGAVVLSKQVGITIGKNTLNIDSENFNSGIYFVSLSYGESVITKKITIIK